MAYYDIYNIWYINKHMHTMGFIEAKIAELLNEIIFLIVLTQ